jgi:uncharacterized protein (DUF4415 family)
MPRTSVKRQILLPTVEEDREIRRAAKSDPDAQPLTASQMKAMVPLKAVRGRPRSENKKLLVSVRYSPEVLSYFRGTGEGWQARMDGVLKEYVVKRSGKRSKSAT